MKRWIYPIQASQTDVEGTDPDNRIEIEFYSETDITAKSSNGAKLRIFKNTQRVINDITSYLTSKGLTVLHSHKSNNNDSDSTYYDVDIAVSSPKGDVKYLYFRVSDHFESALNSERRELYHDRITRQYENISDETDVRNLYAYYPIVVNGKGYNTYDKALNKVKQDIDDALFERGLE